MPPSVLAHALNGILMGAAFFYAVWYRSNVLTNVTTNRTLLLLLFFSMAVGIHGISHALLEKFYGFNTLSIITQ